MILSKEERLPVCGSLEDHEPNNEKREGWQENWLVRNKNELLLYEDHDEAAIMNSFFTTVGEKLASKFPISAMDGLSFISKVLPTIFEIAFRHVDFSIMLVKINIRKAHGSDGMSSGEIVTRIGIVQKVREGQCHAMSCFENFLEL